MSDWQPIETAPLETPVLVWLPKGTRANACGTFRGEDVLAVAALRRDYFEEYHNWDVKEYPPEWYGDIVEFEFGYESTGSYTVDVKLEPTHWMPLPEPPK